MSKIEAVILDWAGTAVDFGSFAPVQAFIEGFRQFGVEPTVAEMRGPMGMLKWNHIHTVMQLPRISEAWEQAHGKAWSKEDVDAVYAASEGAILPILKNFADPKPFVLEAVQALRGAGIKIGSTTGYTDEMMAIVVPAAKQAGYAPDAWFSPNAVGNMGRPYPYMIFENLKKLQISSVRAAIKIGDTVADIQEGRNAGMLSVGVVQGSSVMGLSQEEFLALDDAQRAQECARVRQVYLDSGADDVIENMSELMELIDRVQSRA